ncbi:SC5AC-like protein [Mya arenaria]|uniref:SC5AC-like protein n=1 Tax=Mya arenaria TaxID=6604 RepID=A0ABY7FC67_MYAAR|nr:SC5AC-like protein [Mya arenaria]
MRNHKVQFRIDPDPRVRHTVWGLLIGGIFNWLPNCCNQSAVQRICSMKSIRDAKMYINILEPTFFLDVLDLSTYNYECRSCLLNIPFLVIYGVLLALVGLLLYAYFTLEQCDPYLSGAISNNNQLVPYFVMRVFRNVPGLAGLFIAALFSGALSSLSSGINSMSANTLQDLLIDVLKDAQQYKKTMIAKLVGMDREDPTEEEYIFPCLRGFWKIGYTKTSNQPVDAAEMSKTDVQLENTVPVENLEIEVYHDKTIVK